MDDQSAAIIFLLIVSYMLPGIVACARRHRNRLAIGMLNLLLGWTLLGWIGALVWACTADVEVRQRSAVHKALWPVKEPMPSAPQSPAAQS
jgi:hypothetical protein